VPVLVVGGSLTGLSLSVFLGRLGVPHLVVEKHAATSTHPRGRGNNIRTMELFRVAGAEPRIRAAASALAGNHGILQAESLTSADAEWLFRDMGPDPARSGISPCGWCLCSQNDLEPVLLAQAREQGAAVRFGTELLDFDQDADGVTARLADRATGARRTVRADYLVAADGPRSGIRQALGIGQSGRGDLFANISVTFRAKRLAEAASAAGGTGRPPGEDGAEGDRRFLACYLTNPAADGVLLPVDNREEWVFHAPWHPERGETIEDFTDERCAAHIRAATGLPRLDVEITGRAPWRAAERVADHYAAGRVLLAGDAVHEMPPTGAFGSNTGIQDAHNLAWKLAAVLGGWARPGLLASYEAERRPVAVATGQRASARSAEHRHPGYTPPPGAGTGRDVLAVALGYRYPAGAVLGADPEAPVVPAVFRATGDPGSRAPHLWLTRPDGTRLSTVDLHERAFTLITGPGPQWAGPAAGAARALGVPLDVHRLGADLAPEPQTDWAAAYGVGAAGAVLVRPDGFVAWRAPEPPRDPGAALGEALAALLG
jgi:putative polyketide hydroxylase